MSLLTVLSSLFQIGVVAHGSFDDTRIKNESKNRVISTGRHTYMDSHGREYDVHTDRRVYMTIDNGDKILRDVKTNNVIYNLTNEEKSNRKNNNKEKAISEGKRFYYDPLKRLYCEISTGKYYRRGNGFLDEYGDPYWDTENKDRYVYEYNEGPTDEELEERKRLYDIYIIEKNKCDAFGEIYKSDYFDNMDKYYEKINEVSKLMTRKYEAEAKVIAFDAKMKENYSMRKDVVK